MALVGAALWPGHVAPHELQDNRVTVVQREATHVSLQFAFDGVALMHAQLAPKATRAEFLLAHAAMPLAELEMRLQSLRTRFERETQATSTYGARLQATGWRWPDAAWVQRQLQQLSMAALVGAPTSADPAHDHEDESWAVSADLVATREIRGLRLRLPQALGTVRVVSYRPVQTWRRAPADAVELRF